MDTAALYNTFTHPKVVTSMLLAGIGLGLLLSALLYLFQGTWFLPVGFAAVILGTVIIYMVWLDRQEFRTDDVVPPDISREVPAGKRVLIHADRPVDTEIRSGTPLFSDTRVIMSMLTLAIGLGFAVCVVVIFFRGTWFLPALITALTIGTVTGYLCWLDGQDPRNR
jgi:archaellum biogenesis protein FlaJ (TadC family)